MDENLKNFLEEQENIETNLELSIWSHDDRFIDVLYTSEYEFDGQSIDPKMTLNANGAKVLTLSLPLYIIDRKTGDFIENPRWTYITQQYKIRVIQDKKINEFVLKDYTESHDNNDQLMININFIMAVNIATPCSFFGVKPPPLETSPFCPESL